MRQPLITASRSRQPPSRHPYYPPPLRPLVMVPLPRSFLLVSPPHHPIRPRPSLPLLDPGIQEAFIGSFLKACAKWIVEV